MSCCRLVLVLYLVVAAFAFSHINAAHSADNPNRHIQQVQDIENINAQTLFQTLAMSARVKLQKISPYSNQIAGIIFAFGASGSGIVLVIAGSESDVKWNQYMGQERACLSYQS